MNNYSRIILIISSVFFLSASQKQYSPDFQTKVANYLKAFSLTFSESKDRYDGYEYNDWVLCKKAKYSWKKEITLKSNTSFTNKYKQVAFQRLYFSFYQYETDKLCRTAIDSLLNCFGTDCRKIQWGENMNGVKGTPKIYIFRKREIICCKINCEHVNEYWTKVKQDLIDKFDDNESNFVITGCPGPVEWKREK